MEFVVEYAFIGDRFCTCNLHLYSRANITLCNAVAEPPAYIATPRFDDGPSPPEFSDDDSDKSSPADRKRDAAARKASVYEPLG